MYTPTHPHARALGVAHPNTALAHTLSHTHTHTYTYAAHYTLVSLSRCLVGLCSTPAREVKCRRAGPDCTVGGEGDGWLGGGGLCVCVCWGGGPWWETAAPGWRGLRGGGFRRGVQPPLCNSAVLKARAVLEASGCWGKWECFDAPPFHSAHQSWNRQRLPGQTGCDPRNLCLLTNDDR